jgi:pimeloyl-ACP methyl ester carboxylesterase
MTAPLGFHRNIVRLQVDGVMVDVATIGRGGPLEPIVFLHGFGSTKEDYADIVHHPAFDGRPFLAWDAPGCGESHCGDLSKVSIPFLVATAEAMLQAHGIGRFHLVGHSMGGLTALMLAHANPGRVLNFVDIEGNVAPEDCFLSRQIVDHPSNNAERFFDDFIERTRIAPAFASALYASSLRQKVKAGAVAGIFRSMVELSDHGALLDKFLALPMPRTFMYGQANRPRQTLAGLRTRCPAGARRQARRSRREARRVRPHPGAPPPPRRGRAAAEPPSWPSLCCPWPL